MLKSYKILDVPFNALNRQEALDTLLGFLQTNHNHLVVTPNPEGVMLARRNKDFLHILQKADLVLPDGIGIILAAKIKKLPISDRVPGCDITQSLLEVARDSTCYILGASADVVQKAHKNLLKQGIKVVGAHDGYFNFNSEAEKEIITEIQTLKPDILLVGMGMPKQEEWASKYLHTLPCKITLCIGGTIDILAGKTKRAPKIMRRVGMEWFYRLLTDPYRIKRMLYLPKFAIALLKK